MAGRGGDDDDDDDDTEGFEKMKGVGREHRTG